MKKYRASVKCLECEEEYITRALEKKKLPVKCKKCGSTKLVEKSKDGKTFFEVQ